MRKQHEDGRLNLPRMPVEQGIQFAVTKFFATGSQVHFVAAITQRYRKFMGICSWAFFEKKNYHITGV
jgi:hypothetical protein